MFYDGCGHHASFSLPPVALRELEKPPPSLRDTAADLEEIMAYGEEEDENNPSMETGISSRRWEPDVSFGLFRWNAPLGLFISFDISSYGADTDKVRAIRFRRVLLLEENIIGGRLC